MKDLGYSDYWHDNTNDCATNCTEETSFINKVKSCTVCVGHFVSTAFKAIFKL